MPRPAISIQLYTVRDHLADLDGTLERLAGLGIRSFEPFSLYDRVPETATALARHGLSAPTAHAPFLSDDIEYEGRRVALPPLGMTLQAARALGVHTLIDPMVPADRWQSGADVERTAERLNTAAAEAAAAGVRVGYHNHSFEFHHRIGGTTAYEYFVSRLDPAVVLEVDVYWAAMAGQDVPALLGRLGSRVAALHLKDGNSIRDPFGAGGYAAEQLDQKPLGQGILDIAGILQSARSVDYDVIEFDNVEGDVFAAIDTSLDYLRAARAGMPVTD
ncbi:sugar phosphate isomerase/epimerase family protein [Microbacterium sp. ZW CA_36]|uniref:sugar phosphate isomerase/epimerase family protein n=1 Tax=Microbacterium sp. ZW CA_36 TaxID=3378078 RepID=UPI003852462D